MHTLQIYKGTASSYGDKILKSCIACSCTTDRISNLECPSLQSNCHVGIHCLKRQSPGIETLATLLLVPIQPVDNAQPP